MKNLLAFLILLFGAHSFAQLTYTSKYKWYENQLYKIGETEESSLFVTDKQLSMMKEELTYFKLSTKTGAPTLFEKEAIKIDNHYLKRMQTVQIGDVLYETYAGHKMGMTINESKVYVATRNIENFDFEIQPIEIGVHSPFPEMGIHLYGDEGGIYVHASNFIKKGTPPYVKRFDLELKESWSKSIANFYPDIDEDVVKRVIHDPSEGALIFELDLAKCQDCGMFQRKKEVKSAVLGLSIFTDDGEQVSYVPELPGSMIYSYSGYFYDGTNDQVVGIYEIHEMGKDEYKNANGSGMIFCKWDRATGELKDTKERRYTYGDIITKEAREYLALCGFNDVIDPTKNYPRLRSAGMRKKLSNGNYIIYYHNISGIEDDMYSDKKLNEEINGCDLIICLSPDGEIEWTKFYIGTDSQHNYGVKVTEDDKMAFISLGHSSNYPDGKFNCTKKWDVNNKFIYHYIDLTDGHTISRQSFEDKKFNNEHTRVITNFNEKAEVFTFGLQSNSGAASGRKAEMTAVKVVK